MDFTPPSTFDFEASSSRPSQEGCPKDLLCVGITIALRIPGPLTKLTRRPIVSQLSGNTAAEDLGDCTPLPGCCTSCLPGGRCLVYVCAFRGAQCHHLTPLP